MNFREELGYICAIDDKVSSLKRKGTSVQESLANIRERLQEYELLESRVLDWDSSIKERIKRAMEEKGISGRIESIGSTAPHRLSFVVEAGEYALHRPHPLGMVMNIWVEQEMKNEQAMAFLRYLMPNAALRVGVNTLAEGIEYTDNYSLTVLVRNYTSGVMPKECHIEGNARGEARILKLLFQRYGVYEIYNHGLIPYVAEGLAIRYGSAESALEQILGDLKKGKRPEIPDTNTGHNLFSIVSKSSIFRLKRMTEGVLESGTCKAYPFLPLDWEETHKGRDAFNFFTIVSHRSYQWRPSTIHRIVKAGFQSMRSMGIRHSTEDVYIVPCLGFEHGEPFTLTYISFRGGKGTQVLRIKSELESRLGKFPLISTKGAYDGI